MLNVLLMCSVYTSWLMYLFCFSICFFFFKQKTAYEMRISDWSSDVCSSDLTEAQQTVLALHRMRQQLVKFRTMQTNGLRGLLTEYGEVMGKSRAALDRAMPEVLARLADRLPAVLIDTLREQYNGLAGLDAQIAQIERRLGQWMREEPAVQAIAQIPGVGLLTATAAVAAMGDAKTFRSGREFAARSDEHTSELQSLMRISY